MISSCFGVRIFVDSRPSVATRPSTVPMRTKSPGFSARAYISTRPLIAWFTMPEEPSEITRPAKTLTPLKTSLPLPGT